MNDIPISFLFAALAVLIMLSAFFSGSETGLMSLNRYKLKHQAEKNNGGAKRALELLKKPDQLISLILLGNNFINILITQLATYIGYRLYGDPGIAIATGLLTIILLLFAEVTPKTLAANNPEKIAFIASYVYRPLLKILLPLIIAINWLVKQVFKLFKNSNKISSNDALNSEELRIAVSETAGLIPDTHRDMLLGILDLEKIKVDDIMIPRNEIAGIDLDDDWEDTLSQITRLPYTRIPVYSETVDNLIGVALMRKILPLLMNDNFNPKTLQEITREPYFIPEGTALTTQLINFLQTKRLVGFVVDEYGDIQGLVALEDILEEVVGEFTTDPRATHTAFFQDLDGSYLVEGSTHVRDINSQLHIQLPTKGPRTVNGLILEHLEMIPQAGTSLKIAGYPLEIMHTKNNMVKTVRIQLNRQKQ
ncbi:MAG: HlyC/CorC family transporter [Gammaproteobacteria bacterium]|nr:HlyC/CorC family transporter [Gammaproteobacteria bacterium]